MELSRTIETETGEMIVKRVSVPLGLEELMEGLAKEVILKKPKDIYIFAAEYFSRLLQLRDSGLYRGNVRSAKIAVKSPFRATVVGHNVLSNSEKRGNGNIRGRKPPLPQKSENKDIHEDRRAMIQNHLRQRHEIESQMNQKSGQNAKQPLVRSRLPTRSRPPSKSTDKGEVKSEIETTVESSSRRSSSEKENNTQQKNTRKKMSLRSRSTSVSSSSSTREMKGKKKMDVVKEKNSKICGTEVLNKLSGAAKASYESVELINESQSRGIQRSISVTQDKDGHYEVLNRPTPLHLGDRNSNNIPSDPSNEKTLDANKSLNDGVTNSKQSELVDTKDEEKSAIAIQALWRGRKDRQMLKERSAQGTGTNEVNKRRTSPENAKEINLNLKEDSSTTEAATVENSNRETDDIQSLDSTTKSHSEGDREVKENDGIDEGLNSLNKEYENVEDDGETQGTEKMDDVCLDDTQNAIGENEINNVSKEQSNVNVEKTVVESENDEENSRPHYHRSQTVEVSNNMSNEEQKQKDIETSDQETLPDSSALQKEERSNHTGVRSPLSQISLEKLQDDNLLGDSTPHDLIKSGEEPTEHGESLKVLDDENEKQVDSVNIERSPNHSVNKNGEQIEVPDENEKTGIDEVKTIVHNVSQISTPNADSSEPLVSATKEDTIEGLSQDGEKDIDRDPAAQGIQNETASGTCSELQDSPSKEDANETTNDDEDGNKDNDGGHNVSQISTPNANSSEPLVSATKEDTIEDMSQDGEKDIDRDPAAQGIQNETASGTCSELQDSPSKEDANETKNDDEDGYKDDDGPHTTSHIAKMETSNDDCSDSHSTSSVKDTDEATINDKDGNKDNDEAHTEAQIQPQIESMNDDCSESFCSPTEEDAIEATKNGEDGNEDNDENLTTAHDTEIGTSKGDFVESHSVSSENTNKAINSGKEGDKDHDGSHTTALKEQIETRNDDCSDTNKATNDAKDENENQSHNAVHLTQIGSKDNCSESHSSPSEVDVEKATNNDENEDIDVAPSEVHGAQIKSPSDKSLNPPSEKDTRIAEFKKNRSQSHSVQNLDGAKDEKNVSLEKAYSQDAENSRSRRKRSIQITSDPNASTDAVKDDLEVSESYPERESLSKSASDSVDMARSQTIEKNETTENEDSKSGILVENGGGKKTKSIGSEEIEVESNSSCDEKNNRTVGMEHTNDDKILQKSDKIMDKVRSEDQNEEKDVDIESITADAEEECEQNKEINSENTEHHQGSIEAAVGKPNSSSVHDENDNESHKESENLSNDKGFIEKKVLDSTKNKDTENGDEIPNKENEKGDNEGTTHDEAAESELNSFIGRENDENIKIKSNSDKIEAPSMENEIENSEKINGNSNTEDGSSISDARNESQIQNTENPELSKRESVDNGVDTVEHDKKEDLDIEKQDKDQNIGSQDKENKEISHSDCDSNLVTYNNNDEKKEEKETNQPKNIAIKDNPNNVQDNDVQEIEESITEKEDNEKRISENSDGLEAVEPHSLERKIEELNEIQNATAENTEVKEKDGIEYEADVKTSDSSETHQEVSTNGEHNAEDGNMESISEITKNESPSSEKESAIRIQTIWRGYQARKHLKKLLERNFKKTDHSNLIKELSVDSIKDENENLPETKNENLMSDEENENKRNDELSNTGDEGIEDSDKHQEMGVSDLEKRNVFDNEENEAALKIQSAFRKSRESRLQTGSTNLDVTKSIIHHKSEINENNEIESKVESKKLCDLSSAGFKEMKDEKSYTDEEKNAALKIQKAFRKSKNLLNTEQEGSIVDTNGEEDEGKEDENSKISTEPVSCVISDSKNLDGFSNDEIKAATKIQSTFRQSRKQRMKPKLEDLDLNSDMGKVYLKDILKIQSAWRAYKVRKNIRDVERKITTMENMSGSHTKKSIHLTDQEILKAVTKIQAGLRGYLTRKHFNNIRERNEALDRIKEESYSDYSRMSSTSSTDDQLLEILKQVEGAKIPDTVPEIHSDENSEELNGVHNNMKDLAQEKNQDHTVEQISQSHIKPSDPSGNLDKSGTTLEKNVDQNSSGVHGAENRNKTNGELFEEKDESVTENLKYFEKEEPNELPPEHSSNKLDIHEVESSEGSNLEPQIETNFTPSSESGDVSSKISNNNQNSEGNRRDEIDTENVPEMLTSKTEIESGTAENEIEGNVDEQMNPTSTFQSTVKSGETVNLSDEKEEDFRNDAADETISTTSNILDFRADKDEKHDEEISKHEHKDMSPLSKSDVEQAHSAISEEVHYTSGSLGVTDQVGTKQDDLHDMNSSEKLSSTEIAVRNEETVESGSSIDTTDGNNIVKPKNAENSKNGSTSRRSLKKSKAIDNLAELAEKLENTNEKAEDLKRSTSAPHKVLSEDELNDNEKLVTFEIPEDFKPCVLEKRFSEDLGISKNPETTEHDSVESDKKGADTDVLESNSSQLTNASREIDEINNASKGESEPNEEEENKTNISLSNNDHPQSKDPLEEKDEEINQKVQINTSKDASNCKISKETKKIDEDVEDSNDSSNEKDSKTTKSALTVGDEHPETGDASVEIEEKMNKTNLIKTCPDGSNCAIHKETKTLEKDAKDSTDSLNEKEPKSPRPTLTDFMKKTLDIQPLQSNQKHETTQGAPVFPKNSENSEIGPRSRNDSATKIQSSYRGYKARKHVKSLKSSINVVAASVALAHSGEKNNPSQRTDVSTFDGVMNGSSDNKNLNKNTPPKDLNIQETRTNDVGVGSNGNVNSAGSQESVPAGVEILTTETQHSTDVGEASGDVERGAQPSAPVGDTTNTQDVLSNKPEVESECEMESKRNNSTLRNKNMEAEAATKIQAGFRGYKVRKELKMKDPPSEATIKKTVRRKNSSCLTDNQAKKQKENIDLEEKSAVKIQAGVRGFLVRKRNKRPQKSQE